MVKLTIEQRDWLIKAIGKYVNYEYVSDNIELEDIIEILNQCTEDESDNNKGK